uniref:Putative general secretion pathway protein H n=1 Tax=Rhodopseudomonas palustris (strain BisA53) TaxID=316055 RepID=Q07N87_RHOP5
MPPMSPAGRRSQMPDANAGYILIELVAALALTGVLMILAFPSLPPGTNDPRFRALASDTATLLRNARSDAIARGDVAVAVFDRRRRSIQTKSQWVSVPDAVEFGLLAGSRCETGGERVQLIFRPDGTNCGAVFRFALGPRVARVRLNWLTGYVEILPGDR